jgi:multimeric flavodoxin WrbA
MMDRIRVKILGISCAHRRGRNTAWLVIYALKAAEKFGRRISEIADVDIEFVDLARKNIRACRNCQKFCLPNRGMPWKGARELSEYDCDCIQKDDYIRELVPKFAEADGFIFGSPVYTHSYTSQFRRLMERIAGVTLFQGHISGKPAGAVTVATVPVFGGQEHCLHDMNTVFQAIEMIPVSWKLGAPGCSGYPFGPTPANDDGRAIGVRNDLEAKKLAVLVGRRVAEYAVMLRLAKLELGAIYTREFMQHYHPPHGDETWAWGRLDEEDKRFMMSLYE